MTVEIGLNIAKTRWDWQTIRHFCNISFAQTNLLTLLRTRYILSECHWRLTNKFKCPATIHLLRKKNKCGKCAKGIITSKFEVNFEITRAGNSPVHKSGQIPRIERISFSRSQRSGCSTGYDTSIHTQVVCKWFCAPFHGGRISAIEDTRLVLLEPRVRGTRPCP